MGGGMRISAKGRYALAAMVHMAPGHIKAMHHIDQYRKSWGFQRYT